MNYTEMMFNEEYFMHSAQMRAVHWNLTKLTEIAWYY